MKTTHILRAGVWCAIGAVLLGGLAGAAQPDSFRSWSLGDDDAAWAAGFGGVQTFTKPSRDAVMGFNAPTQVMEILVRGGQRVSAGQLLVRGDDAEQQAIVKQTRIRAESGLQVDRAQKTYDLAIVEFKNTEDALARGGSNQFELDRARLSMETAGIDVQTAQLNLDLEAVRLEQAQALLDQLRIVAPFNGLIDEVAVDVGRSIDRAQPVVRVVSIDPLWLDVPAPTERTIELGLKAGDSAWVLLDAPGDRVVARGTIIEVSPVADYASRSRRVRVEVSNSSALPPGLRAWVRFEEPPADFDPMAGE